jgi:hypothetical protein
MRRPRTLLLTPPVLIWAVTHPIRSVSVRLIYSGMGGALAAGEAVPVMPVVVRLLDGLAAAVRLARPTRVVRVVVSFILAAKSW